MKKIDISRLERMRSTNLKIGFVLALSLMLVAFSWTSDRENYQDLFDDEPLTSELEITRTYQEPKKESPPPPKPTIENKIIIESLVPTLLSTAIELTKPEPAQSFSPNVAVAAPVTTVAPPAPKPEYKTEEIFIVVQDAPLFGSCYDEYISKEERKKCSDAALMKYLSSNLNYPSVAREMGIEGLVVIKFVVEKDGSITNAEIVRDIGGRCGEEAMRVVGKMPLWRPGKQQGRAVRVQYNLPVKFKLK